MSSDQAPRVYQEWSYLGGCLKLNRQGRLDIACVRNLDKQFVYLLGLTLVMSIIVLIFAMVN